MTPLLVDLGAATSQSTPPFAPSPGTPALVDLGASTAQPPIAPATPSAAPPPTTDSTLIDLTSEEVEASGLTITLRSALNVLAEIPVRALRRDAVKWSQIVKNRERWRTTSGTGLDLANESREVFRSLGLGDDFLRAVAVAGVVEVSIPFTSEDVGWEARIFPWEALLSVATKPWRDFHSLYVVRHLVWSGEADQRSDGNGLLYVESIPAALRNWNFDSERQRVDSGLAEKFPKTWSFNDTRNAIIQTIAEVRPGLIHVAGFDTWQGAALLGLPYTKERRDGLMLCGDSGEPDEINGETLFDFLRDIPVRPWLVSLNVYNSAARLAALAVAGGARAAIGLQDIFDDDMAEVFYSRVYQALPRDDPSSGVLQAFLTAQETIQKQAQRLTGSGVVLWSDQTIANQDLGRFATGAARGLATTSSTGDGGPAGGTPLGGGTGDGSLPVGPPVSPESAAAAGWPFKVYKIKPYDKLNYSMLHNKCAVFENFVLCRGKGLGHAVSQVTVRAELYLGLPSPCSWEQTTDIEELDEPSLHTKIRLPLISDLQRSLKNTLRTNLKVRIEYNSCVYYQETFPVELLAIDEWRDDDLARAWLPSFVMPGDPIVPEIVDAAQRYLTALVDDDAAGFDGYQRLGAANPERPAQVYTAEEVIDPQVRAIWSSPGGR